MSPPTFREFYPEVARLVRRVVLQTPLARKIMRKSGFRPGTGSAPIAAEWPILSIPPVVVAGGCPRDPYPPDFVGRPEGMADDFYADVLLAETGDEAALDAVKDWLSFLSYGVSFLESSGTPENPQRVRVNGGCPVECELVIDFPSFYVQAVRMNGRRGPLAAGTYWHPLDLTGYATKWDFSAVSEIKSQTAVAQGADATLRPVYAVTYPDLIAGNWDYLTDGIDCSAAGVFSTAWAPPPSEAADDVFVAFVMEAGSSVSSFAMGAAEVRAR